MNSLAGKVAQALLKMNKRVAQKHGSQNERIDDQAETFHAVDDVDIFSYMKGGRGFARIENCVDVATMWFE